jgi:hypothetical protein
MLFTLIVFVAEKDQEMQFAFFDLTLAERRAWGRPTLVNLLFDSEECGKPAQHGNL